MNSHFYCFLICYFFTIFIFYFFLTTDIANRGLDIPNDDVVNYFAPPTGTDANQLPIQVAVGERLVLVLALQLGFHLQEENRHVMVPHPVS
jgi:hypothetical protein